MSVKAGIVATVANIIPIALNFGVRGYFNIPLNTGTCMVAAIALRIAGDCILRQGEEGHAMYMLLSGSARVSVETQGRSVDISTVRPGELLGETALVGSGFRSANVMALEQTDLLRIDEASLDRIRRRFPKIAARLFMNIASVLGERLRIQNLAGISRNDLESQKALARLLCVNRRLPDVLRIPNR